jgi:uncharacterized protein (DUF2236 family)
MTLRDSDLVGEADLERQLERVRAASAGDAAGAFGPCSLIWRIDREAAIFLGAARALLLQLAHPWVAAAITEHSQALADPIGRFHRTFGIVFRMVFGTLEQALSAARELHRRHAGIAGILPETVGPFPAGSPYRANDIAALRWVHATLIDTALLLHELTLAPLAPAEREAYYGDARLFAALFGIPAERLPADWQEFSAYRDAMLRSDILSVSNAARQIAEAIFAGAPGRVRIPSWYRALTLQILPLPLRDGFHFVYGAAERRAADRALARLRWMYPAVPRCLRYVGPYQEARARLSGRTRPNLPTQLLNRFWIGRPWMTQ